MVLTRDIVAGNGMLLLSAGAVLNAANIARLVVYEKELSSDLPVYVSRAIEEEADALTSKVS